MKISNFYPGMNPLLAKTLIKELSYKDENFVKADDNDDIENEDDYEKLYFELKEKLESLEKENALLKMQQLELSENNDILSTRLERIEKQFDKNLDTIISSIYRIKTFKEAVDATLQFNRDWFISVQLSEDGKIKFAQTLLEIVKPILKEENLELISNIANRDSKTLQDIWAGKTDEESGITPKLSSYEQNDL